MVASDRGDILALTDAAGAPFAAYRYDAWGNPQGTGNLATGIWTQSTSLIDATLAAAIAIRQSLRYAGYAYDQESGFYYLSARYYDSATRQFTSKDPAKADGEESAYQYCSGDPVGRVDVTGRIWRRLTSSHQYKVYLPAECVAYVEYTAEWYYDGHTTKGELAAISRSYNIPFFAAMGSHITYGGITGNSVYYSSGNKYGYKWKTSFIYCHHYGLAKLSAPVWNATWYVRIQVNGFGQISWGGWVEYVTF